MGIICGGEMNRFELYYLTIDFEYCSSRSFFSIRRLFYLVYIIKNVYICSVEL